MAFEPVAIIGMAGRFCGARDVDAFWDNIHRGVETVRYYSDEELLDEGVKPLSLANPQYVKAGGPIEDGDRFDAAFFEYSDREAELMDPQQRVLLECAWEVLERTGYAPGSYSGRIGVYGGSRISEYMLFNQNVPNLAARKENILGPIVRSSICSWSSVRKSNNSGIRFRNFVKIVTDQTAAPVMLIAMSDPPSVKTNVADYCSSIGGEMTMGCTVGCMISDRTYAPVTSEAAQPMVACATSVTRFGDTEVQE